ncbi:MAG: NAD-dependent DNA ligase LigA [Bulleidia sp.]
MENNQLKKMRALVDRLNEASQAYYNGQAEKMTDYEWDAMFDELRQLEKTTGTILEDSPTINVSADTTAGQKEPHEYAALSLAKTKKTSELVRWAENRKIWLSWKLDGLTLVVTYDHGRLQKVVTRGDGHIGTNITHLASAIEGILPKIRETGHLVIRGEAVISYEDFNRFVMESGEDYANPRNLASGSLSLKDVEEVRKRCIHWIPFTLVHTDSPISSWGAQMDYLKDLGFTVVDHEAIDLPDQSHVDETVKRWSDTVSEGRNPYPVDGLVITFDDTAYAQSGEVTGHHAVRAGYAFKWQDTVAQAVLDHIEWSCAASAITPVAVFEPVELEGTTVRRASLCNISECRRLDIGDRGTLLSVIKANKIIPKVIAVTKKEGELVIPDHCPVCGAPSIIDISEVSGTRVLRCTNPDCAARKLRKFTRFVSKHGCDIDGISEMTLSRFINEGWISNNGDIYRLVSHRDEIAKLDGFGEKSADNMVSSITKARTVADTKLLYALNIPLVGQDVAKRLLGAYPLDQLVDQAVNTKDEGIFSSIDGIGPEKSTSFVRWFQDETNLRDYRDLIGQITVEATQLSPKGNRCEGLTFVVTGDVHHYKNRNELKAYIESQGGKVTGSVSKSTDFLINNDVESTSSKNTKAKTLGIPILSEEDFLDQFVN